MKLNQITNQDVETVLENVTVTDDNCWLFPYIMANGYPQLQTAGRHFLVHRMMKIWELGRDLEDNEVIHHTCGNKNCVNPRHLEVMTAEEHSRLHKERLSDEEVLLAITLYDCTDLTLKEVSKEMKQAFGVDISFSHIANTIAGRYKQGLYEKYLKDNDRLDELTQ